MCRTPSRSPASTRTGGRGEGLGNFCRSAIFRSKGFWDTDSYLIPRGVILNRDLSTIHPIDLDADNEIQEYVSHSWYKYSQGDAEGRTVQGRDGTQHTGPKPPYKHLDVNRSTLAMLRWQAHAWDQPPPVLMLHAGVARA
jgi:hydrogenase large subunit